MAERIRTISVGDCESDIGISDVFSSSIHSEPSLMNTSQISTSSQDSHRGHMSKSPHNLPSKRVSRDEITRVIVRLIINSYRLILGRHIIVSLSETRRMCSLSLRTRSTRPDSDPLDRRQARHNRQLRKLNSGRYSTATALVHHQGVGRAIRSVFDQEIPAEPQVARRDAPPLRVRSTHQRLARPE